MLLFITFLSREPGSRDGIDWMPFSTLGSGPRGDAFVLENVLLFVPFGVLTARGLRENEAGLEYIMYGMCSQSVH